MSAPRIVPLQERLLHPELCMPALPQAWVDASVRLFAVVWPGSFGDRDWQVGDVLVCAGAAETADVVVLEARGKGHPRLGTVDGSALYGAAGEPCSPARWQVVGPVVTVLRAGALQGRQFEPAPGWRALELRDGAVAGLSHGPAPLRVLAGRGTRRPQVPTVGQLSLFQRAA